MTSLYDVFSAIKADEADHVSTMESCLDPNVSVRSPSIERRILTGVALASVAQLIAASGGGLSTSTDLVADETAIQALSSTNAVEAAVAGAAAAASQLAGEAGGEEAVAAVSSLGNFVSDTIAALLRILATIL